MVVTMEPVKWRNPKSKDYTSYSFYYDGQSVPMTLLTKSNRSILTICYGPLMIRGLFTVLDFSVSLSYGSDNDDQKRVAELKIKDETNRHISVVQKRLCFCLSISKKPRLSSHI